MQVTSTLKDLMKECRQCCIPSFESNVELGSQREVESKKRQQQTKKRQQIQIQTFGQTCKRQLIRHDK